MLLKTGSGLFKLYSKNLANWGKETKESEMFLKMSGFLLFKRETHIDIFDNYKDETLKVEIHLIDSESYLK